MPHPSRDVLVLGAYFVERESRIDHVARELAGSRRWHVEQRWVALGPAARTGVEPWTVALSRGEPKFILVNRQLAAVDLDRYAYVLVVDDDVTLPPGFLDAYLDLVGRYGFSLAQPARTHGSFTDHHFVSQLQGLRARQTRFVEIGPLFSIAAEALSTLTPFDEQSPMGWGYDLVWPLLMERAGMTMGIVDETPIAHDLRKPATSYAHGVAASQMAAFLLRQPHLEPLQAFHIVRSYA